MGSLPRIQGLAATRISTEIYTMSQVRRIPRVRQRAPMQNTTLPVGAFQRLFSRAWKFSLTLAITSLGPRVPGPADIGINCQDDYAGYTGADHYCEDQVFLA